MSAQSLTALELANQVRYGKARVKRELHDRRLSLPAALGDPRAQRAHVLELLLMVRGLGRSKAARAMKVAGVLPSRRVESLTRAQRDQLLSVLAGWPAVAEAAGLRER